MTTENENTVSWSLFDELYHDYYNFAHEVKWMASAIGATAEDTRGDFILHKMVDVADRALDEIWKKAIAGRKKS